MKRRTAITATIAAGIAVLILAGGADSCTAESNQDAGVSNRETGPADLINFPDGYSNVAHKCDGPNMVYVIYHGNFVEGPKPYGSMAVVAGDPRCAK